MRPLTLQKQSQPVSTDTRAASSSSSRRMCSMQRPVNESQKAVLGWLATGLQGPPPVPAYKTCAVALETRGLAKVSRARGVWTATPTEAGRYYSKHGRYPPIEPPRNTPQSEQPPAMPRAVSAIKPAH